MLKQLPGTIIFAVMGLGLPLISSEPAFSQEPNRPKLTVSGVSLGPTGDGFYNANVNLTLQRTGNPQIGFGLYFQHVKSLEELYTKLRPAADNLAEELKGAEIVIP